MSCLHIRPPKCHVHFHEPQQCWQLRCTFQCTDRTRDASPLVPLSFPLGPSVPPATHCSPGAGWVLGCLLQLTGCRPWASPLPAGSLSLGAVQHQGMDLLSGLLLPLTRGDPIFHAPRCCCVQLLPCPRLWDHHLPSSHPQLHSAGQEGQASSFKGLFFLDPDQRLLWNLPEGSFSSDVAQGNTGESQVVSSASLLASAALCEGSGTRSILCHLCHKPPGWEAGGVGSAGAGDTCGFAAIPVGLDPSLPSCPRAQSHDTNPTAPGWTRRPPTTSSLQTRLLYPPLHGISDFVLEVSHPSLSDEKKNK